MDETKTPHMQLVSARALVMLHNQIYPYSHVRFPVLEENRPTF